MRKTATRGFYNKTTVG